MPGFTFLLTNPRTYLTAGEKYSEEYSEEWSLSFDATIQLPERDHHGYRDSFEVICDGKTYDGFKLDGVANIMPHTSKTNQSLSAELQNKPGYIYVGYMKPTEQFPEEDPPHFEIETSLSSDTFFRLLQANPEKHLIKLYVSTISLVDEKVLQGEGLVYGHDPNGKEAVWHVEKKNTARLDFLRFTITPPSENASESKPSKEA